MYFKLRRQPRRPEWTRPAINGIPTLFVYVNTASGYAPAIPPRTLRPKPILSQTGF